VVTADTWNDLVMDLATNVVVLYVDEWGETGINTMFTEFNANFIPVYE